MQPAAESWLTALSLVRADSGSVSDSSPQQLQTLDYITECEQKLGQRPGRRRRSLQRQAKQQQAMKQRDLELDDQLRYTISVACSGVIRGVRLPVQPLAACNFIVWLLRRLMYFMQVLAGVAADVAGLGVRFQWQGAASDAGAARVYVRLETGWRTH